jgi:hypothetical protein
LPRSLLEHSRRPGKPIDPEGAAAIAGMTLAYAARCASRVLMISDRIAARSSSPVRFWNVLNVASRVGQRPQVERIENVMVVFGKVAQPIARSSRWTERFRTSQLSRRSHSGKSLSGLLLPPACASFTFSIASPFG